MLIKGVTVEKVFKCSNCGSISFKKNGDLACNCEKEKHLTNFALSDDLKKIGFPQQKSQFVYRHWRFNGNVILDERKDRYYDYPRYRKMGFSSSIICATFLVSELCNILKYNSIIPLFIYNAGTEKWIVSWKGIDAEETEMAQACGKLIMKLFIERIISFRECGMLSGKEIVMEEKPGYTANTHFGGIFKCGIDFCEQCGNCLACYWENECGGTGWEHNKHLQARIFKY